MTYQKIPKSASWTPQIQKKTPSFAPPPIVVQRAEVSGDTEVPMPEYKPLPPDYKVEDHPLLRQFKRSKQIQAKTSQTPVGTPDEWWDASIDWVSDAWNDTTETLGNAWNTSSQWVSDNYNSISDWGHGILDAAGFFPGLGAIPDAINTLWYGAEGIAGKEGAWGDAAWSAAAVVPLFGDGAAAIGKGGKYINKAGKIADKASDAAKVGDKLKDGSKAVDKLQDGAKASKKIGDSKKLGKNLEAKGIKRPEGAEAHHIIAGDCAKAEQARAKLKRYGIDINDADNGVFLPGPKSDAPGMPHRKIHTNRYYDEVNRRLQNANGKEEVIEVLEQISKELTDGTFPI